jgi:hypothetical protein
LQWISLSRKAFSPRTPQVVGRYHPVEHPCSLASSILCPRPTSQARACRDYGHWPSSTGPTVGHDRPPLGSPGFRAKSLHTCSGSQTPRVRCATRDIAAHQYCLPHHNTRSALESVISEVNCHACMPPVNASPHSYEIPTHHSGSRLVANHYHVVDLHHLPFADFYRRFHYVPRIFPSL